MKTTLQTQTGSNDASFFISAFDELEDVIEEIVN